MQTEKPLPISCPELEQVEEPSHTASQRVVATRKGTSALDPAPELSSGLAHSL